MLLSNYHTHSKFCDGNTFLEPMVQKAIELGFSELGFSSHAPYKHKECCLMKIEDVEEYFSEIKRLKSKYKSEINVLTGFEIDHISGHENYDWFNSPELDYTLGSVHYIYKKSLDYFFTVDTDQKRFRTDLNRIYSGNIQGLIKDYYFSIREMVRNFKPDILGHMDIVKKFNLSGGYFSEESAWYKDEIEKTLEDIKTSGTIIEINTRGYYRGWTKEFYPSNWIINKCIDLNIPMIINVDAHDPIHLKKGVDCIREVIDYDALKPFLLDSLAL